MLEQYKSTQKTRKESGKKRGRISADGYYFWPVERETTPAGVPTALSSSHSLLFLSRFTLTTFIYIYRLSAHCSEWKKSTSHSFSWWAKNTSIERNIHSTDFKQLNFRPSSVHFQSKSTHPLLRKGSHFYRRVCFLHDTINCFFCESFSFGRWAGMANRTRLKIVDLWKSARVFFPSFLLIDLIEKNKNRVGLLNRKFSIHFLAWENVNDEADLTSIEKKI